MPLAADPLYLKVQRALARALAEGQFLPGDALPGEKTLALEHGVSIGTLRAAVDGLVAEGMLIRQQGKGTFVAEHDRDRLRFYFFHIVEHDAEKEGYPDVGLVQFGQMKADAAVATKLGLARGATVFHIQNRVRLLGEVVAVDDIWVCAIKFSGLTEGRVRNRSSTLYQLYQSEFGLTVVRSSERLRAVGCVAAHARLLGVSVGAPALEIRRQAVAYDGTPVEWRVSTVNTAAHEYANELGK